MTNPAQHCASRIISSFWMPTFLMALIGVLTIFATLPCQAQTFTVLHSFTGGQDGSAPDSGVAIDRAGNVYGTASSGGNTNNGVVFKMTHKQSGWLLSPLYLFAGSNDGYTPGPVAIGPDGNLYGATYQGGGNGCQGVGCGTVYKITPSATFCRTASCFGTETVLHRFTGGGGDGSHPLNVALVFDQNGNIYGTTLGGGAGCTAGCGTVFKLTRASGWAETVVYTFTGQDDGNSPSAGVILDSADDLYGTAGGGGFYGGGTVFELLNTESGYLEQTLQSLGVDRPAGYTLEAGLIFDQFGNLYGASSYGGTGGGGTAFELTAIDRNLEILYNFSGAAGPFGGLLLDNAGNLYGVTIFDGAYLHGAVFKLTPSGGSWTYTSLHDFTGGSDGSLPFGPLVFDARGNLYGTAEQGGNLTCNPPYGCGVVFEITP